MTTETVTVTTPAESPPPSTEYASVALLDRVARCLSGERGPDRTERDELVKEINDLLRRHLLVMLARM